MDLSWSLNDSPGIKSGSRDSKVNEIVPLALGILSDPPTLVLIYESNEVGKLKKKKRKRRIPLRNFSVRSDVGKTVFGIQQRHSEYLQSVPSVTLEKMVHIIQHVQNGLSVEEAVAKVNQKYDINPDEDLNKVSVAELSRKKEIMEESFQKSLITPNDPEFVYDKQVDFEKSTIQKKENVWDEDGDEEDGNVLVMNFSTPKPEEKMDLTSDKLERPPEDEEANPENSADDSESDKSESGKYDVPDNNSASCMHASASADEITKPTTETKIDPESTRPVNSIYDEFEIPDEDFW